MLVFDSCLPVYQSAGWPVWVSAVWRCSWAWIRSDFSLSPLGRCAPSPPRGAAGSWTWPADWPAETGRHVWGPLPCAGSLTASPGKTKINIHVFVQINTDILCMGTHGETDYVCTMHFIQPGMCFQAPHIQLWISLKQTPWVMFHRYGWGYRASSQSVLSTLLACRASIILDGSVYTAKLSNNGCRLCNFYSEMKSDFMLQKRWVETSYSNRGSYSNLPCCFDGDA